jgi:hypothetical protein
MAQTKARNSRSTRSKSSKSSGSKSSGRSTGSKSRSTSSRSRNGASAQSSRPSSSSSRKRTTTTRTSGDGADKSRLTEFAEKAKTPAAAGGAALVGLAGGLALSRTRKRKGVLERIPKPNMKNVKMPKVKAPKIKPDEALKKVGSAAGEVADRSQRVGQVAAEIQKASDSLAKKS